jgi:hypothetical protein
MALVLAAPLVKGLLATAIRTAGSKAIQPYVTNLVGQGVGKKAATQIAKQYTKTVGKANKTGSFPLVNKTTNRNFANSLSGNQRVELQRKGLLQSDVPITASKGKMLGTGGMQRQVQQQLSLQAAPRFNFPPNPVGGPAFTAPIQTTAQRQAAARAAAARARQTQAERNAAQAAFNRRKEIDAYNRPITQTVDQGLGLGTQAKIAGGLATVPIAASILSPTEQQAPAVQAVSSAAPVDTTMRDISQVISPTESATSKQIINAALLRAGLSMMQGGNVGDALTAAGTVADSRNQFRTGAEALAAGQRNLGKTATIYVSQNKDGTYKYSGQTDTAASVLAGLFDNEKVQQVPKGKITKEQRDALAVIIKQQQPNATEQDITDTLADRGYTYP